MDLFEHLRVIRRKRWRVLLSSALLALLMFAWSDSKEPVYRAVALVSLTSGRAVSGQSVSEAEISFLTRSYAQVAGTKPVLVEASRRSGVPFGGPAGPATMSAQAGDSPGFLTITAEAPSPSAASSLATGGADALVAAVEAQQRAILRDALDPVQSEIRFLEEQLGQAPPNSSERAALQARLAAILSVATERRLAAVDRLSLVATPIGGSTPVSPTPLRDATLAFLVALVLNAELAVLSATMKDRFSTEQTDDSIADLTGLRVLARVPAGGDAKHIEPFRGLRTNMMFIDTGVALRSVAVISANPNEGKTFTAVHLAQTTASLDVPVVLVDGDLRRPSVHIAMGVGLAPGLTDLLSGSDIQGLLEPAPGVTGLQVLTAGSSIHDPAAMLGSRHFEDAIGLLDWAGMVVVDTPPCALFSDALAIASRCTAAIIVVDVKTTRRRSVRSLVRQLRDVGANPIGIVLNRTESSPSAYKHYQRAGSTRK